jgi:mono/diheme cytochrome c family protein
MKPNILKKLVLSTLLILILTACGGQRVTPTQSEAVSDPAVAVAMSFTNQVLPVFEESCTRCHGSSRQSGGLRLDSYAALVAGGKDGAVVVPGDAPSSLLVELITSGEMPKNAAPLTDEKIQVIIEWVDTGALDN